MKKIDWAMVILQVIIVILLVSLLVCIGILIYGLFNPSILAEPTVTDWTIRQNGFTTIHNTFHVISMS